MGTAVTNAEGIRTSRRSRTRPDKPLPAPPTAPKLAWRRILAEIDAQNLRWAVTVNRIMTTLVVASGVLVLALWPAIGSQLALPLLALCVILTCYYGLCGFYLTRRGAALPFWTQWVNTALEATVPTIIVAVVAHTKGGEWATTSPTILVYAALIVVSAARMHPELVLFGTGLAILEYLGLYYLVLRPDFGATVLATAEPWAAWERVFWLGCCGIVSAFVTYKGRDLALFGGTQALEKSRLEREFGKYVSRDVADAILRGDTGFGKAERREVSVLFCDLRHFTGICERQPAESVVELLNTYFAQACAIIEAHGGTVNKFLGDGILALFNAPDEHPNHTRAAAEAAHDLLAVADELRRRRGIWEGFDVGIGLDTGSVVVGPIGAPHRLEYTAIGSTVNRAARLQGLSRTGGHRIVLSSAFVERLGPNANVLSLGAVSLKGFSLPEPVFVFRHS